MSAPYRIADLFSMPDCPRLIIKIGSSLLIAPDGSVRRAWLSAVVANIVERKKAGQQVIVVSSGAIALGARRLGFIKGGRASLEDSQAAAAVGQIELAGVWSELFATHDIQAAQLLLTLDDLEDRQRYLNVSATINRLLEAGAVPVLNENDTVATEEIRFGDNDRLAARVGQATLAAGVILLSDIDGLYTANPHHDAAATRIAVVDQITPEIEAMAGGVGTSGMGSGGMISKIQAAKIAVSGGAHLAIISGKQDDPLGVFEQTGVSTIFLARESAPAARKRWLAGRLTVAGAVRVDAGAMRALADSKSLLPAGVISISGTFERGDVVDVVLGESMAFARGLISYASVDAARIVGLKTTDIEAVLGYAPRAAMIHRDDLVML